ncbi:hypothetical protein N2152v2_002256 [Parachlorella kessleri]
MRLPPGHVAGQGVLKPSGYGGFGERMLKTMGWEKGQGLGLNANGIKEAIQVKKKEDTVGVGGNGSWKWEEKYWETAYESVQLTNKGSDSSDDDSSDDDSEAGFGGTINRDGTLSSASAHELRLLKALSKGPSTGRFGGREAKMARIREQEAKLAAEYAARLGVSAATATATTVTTTAAAAAGASDRSETTSEIRLPSGSTAAAAGAEAGAPSESNGKKVKKVGKKKVKEAEAAAGEAGADSGSSRKKQRKGDQKDSTTAAEDAAASQGSGEQQQVQQQAQQRQMPQQRVVIEPAIESSAPMAEFKPTPREGKLGSWWGAKRFVSAGCLEGAKKDVQGPKERMVFTEGDQERVYMAAHAGKVAKGTKKGLGQSQAVGKVGGVKWAGSKVTFQDDDNASAGDGSDDRQRCPKLAAVGSSTHLDALAGAEVAAPGASGGRDEGQGGEEQPNGPAATSAAAEVAGRAPVWQAGVKWRKLITQALQAAPGGALKLKDLQKQVAAAALEKLGAAAPSGGGKKELRAEVAARVQGSSRFVVEGKVVRLKSYGG